MNEESNNIERGRLEIWRRQKLLITYLVLFIPFGFFVLAPIEHFFGKAAFFILPGIYIAVGFTINYWLLNTPCPNCGKPILKNYKKVRYRKCTYCGLDLRPSNFDYKISFKRIPYKQPKE